MGVSLPGIESTVQYAYMSVVHFIAGKVGAKRTPPEPYVRLEPSLLQ